MSYRLKIMTSSSPSISSTVSHLSSGVAGCDWLSELWNAFDTAIYYVNTGFSSVSANEQVEICQVNPVVTQRSELALLYGQQRL